MNASVHFVYGSRLPPIAAAQSMRPGSESPVAWKFSAYGHRLFYGIITAERLLYHAHAASLRRHAEILWRAVSDGTCQLYHKA